MSVDHKLFVACKPEMVLDLYQLVYTRIEKEYTKRMKALCVEYKVGNIFFIPEDIRSKLHRPTVNGYGFDFMKIEFGFGYENRQLRMTHVCSYDYNDIYDGFKVIFIIGHWGEHQEIMDIVKDVLVQYGETYEIVNDCTDTWKKVNL